ncbi:MAG: hypothetical protein ACRDJV_10255 [Actinomycetota bacterium]|jgi:transposase-like protein
MSSGSATPHAQPFYCPYCGEEDFVPSGETAGGYECNSCGRHYTVKFLGLTARAASREGS